MSSMTHGIERGREVVARWRPAILGALVVVVVFAVSAAAQPLVGATPMSTIVDRLVGVAPPADKASDTPPNLNATFGVLRRPRMSTDVLPADAIKGLEGYVRAFGVNPELSRRVAQLGNETLYLVAGDRALCLIDEYGGGGCAQESDVLSGRLNGGEMGAPRFAPGQYRNYGLVPDGVSKVSLTLADGRTETAAVQDNVWVLDSTSDLNSYSFTGPDGTQTFDTHS